VSKSKPVVKLTYTTLIEEARALVRPKGPACMVCSLPMRAEIDAAIRGGAPITGLTRALAKRGLTLARQTLMRHRENHLEARG